MSSQFPTATLRLADLFASPFVFSIPLYQRPYSWDAKHAGQLLTDLSNAAGLAPDGSGYPYHFFGTILLMEPTGSQVTADNADREFDVVDGQQRLVTLCILLAVLRDLDGSGDAFERIEALLRSSKPGMTPVRYRARLRAGDQDFLERHVLTPGSCSEMPREDLTAAQKCMLAVREHLVAELSDLDARDRLRLLDYLTNDCHFVVIQPREIDLAYRLFTTINERGKKLARNDILKADVLSRLEDAKAETAAETWDAASVDLGADFEPFFSHLKSAYGHSKPQIVASVRAILTDAGGPEAFMDQVFLPMSAAYGAICRAGSTSCQLPPEVRRPLIYLNRLRDSDWAPAAMLTLRLYGDRPETAAQLLAEIDRIAHVHRFLCLGSGKRQTRFAAIIKALRSGLAPGDASVFAVSRDDTRQIAFHLKDFYRRNQMMCKLLLVRLDEVMAGREPDIRLPELSVEHVMPSRPAATSEWRRLFPDPAEREAATVSLGNLIVVPPSYNDKAGNLTFARKKDIYAGAAGSTVTSPMLDWVVARKIWGPDEIAERQHMLLKLIAQHFRLDFELSPTTKKRAFWNFAPTA